MFIFYDLHFDGIDDVNDEHIGDFDAFPQDILNISLFSFNGDELNGLGDTKDSTPFVRLIFGVYSFQSISRSIS